MRSIVSAVKVAQRLEVRDTILENLPADLIALLVRLAVNIGLTSSAHTRSDPLAIITPFFTKF